MSASNPSKSALSPFVFRHIGPREHEIAKMLGYLGYSSLDELTSTVVPKQIQFNQPLNVPAGVSEEEALAELRGVLSRNKVLKSFIGQGYYGTHTPKVIQRNVLENPAWYTAYTPYQPEISQGRLEVLFYYQTLVTELTGLEIANASLLDEATAAAEAMTLCQRVGKGSGNRFLVSRHCHPQTIELIQTRAQPLNIEVVLFDERAGVSDWSGVFGVIVQYPATDGVVTNHEKLIADAHAHQALVVMATDLLALMLLKSPGAMGADVAVGNSQRFGVPFGLGGPHAAFMATRDAFKRSMPGRLVGQSIDSHGKPAFRLSLQTREQHIRREKATSNICTAQALLAIMATLYAVYHGPEGLRAIAKRVHTRATELYNALVAAGLKCSGDQFFDTVVVEVGGKAEAIAAQAVAAGFNLRRFSPTALGISCDETTSPADVAALAKLFGAAVPTVAERTHLPADQLRDDVILTQEVFHKYRSETEMMRYLRRLSEMDIALDRAMISLGSCTMKLNAAAEMTPVTWPEINSIHPYAPADQWVGYRDMIAQLEKWLCACTGYDAISLQPNAGSQGEYAGLLAIKQYHESRGDHHRDICLIPSSAHGTNPASAQMVNMKVVVVKCDDDGNVDLADLDEKIAQNSGKVAAIMITYPSTHGVFEEGVTAVCEKVHAAGGQVYIDGANLNALVGVAQPGKFLHSARWWWPGRRSGRRAGASRSVPPQGRHQSRSPRAAGQCRPVWQRQHPADLLDVHPDDGARRAADGDPSRNSECQLHGQAIAGELRNSLHREPRPGGSRVHCRYPAAGQGGPCVSGRHRQAADRFRIPCSDDVISGWWNVDDRADRERVAVRAGPVLPGDEADLQRVRKGQVGRMVSGKQSAAERPAYAGLDSRRGFDPGLSATTGGLS
ncbi:MAG: aminomethyl-transferring glycine dehydrogenase [Blastopirellula sp.]|nr:aminomethyl-transferring glycine dehydrogenase [Blastopirellula sp.]